MKRLFKEFIKIFLFTNLAVFTIFMVFAFPLFISLSTGNFCWLFLYCITIPIGIIFGMEIDDN